MKAKIRTVDARPTVANVGVTVHRRFWGWMKRAPATTRSTRGISLTTVVT
jgi:hypothetical protein